MAIETPPLLYGVWLTGTGWLNWHGREFASENRLMAEEALRMCKPAQGRVALIDDSMKLLRDYFLQQERAKNERRLVNRIRKLYKRIVTNNARKGRNTSEVTDGIS